MLIKLFHNYSKFREICLRTKDWQHTSRMKQKDHLRFLLPVVTVRIMFSRCSALCLRRICIQALPFDIIY